MQYARFTLSALSAATLLALAACGGGSDGGTPAAVAPVAPVVPVTPPITVTGSAPVVTADPLAVVFVPSTETSTRSTTQSIASNSFGASFQKTTSEGAYTTIGPDANSLITLTSGKVVDVAGATNYAIGRWTDGSSNILGNISSNQGAHYAVGTPITLARVLGPTAKLNCALTAATSPTAVSGNFAPGKLDSATAVINLNGPLVDRIDLGLTIGSDAGVTKSLTDGALINGISPANGALVHVQVFGTDASNPFLAVGYTMPMPSSGDVSGVVILKCSQASVIL